MEAFKYAILIFEALNFDNLYTEPALFWSEVIRLSRYRSPSGPPIWFSGCHFSEVAQRDYRFTYTCSIREDATHHFGSAQKPAEEYVLRNISPCVKFNRNVVQARVCSLHSPDIRHFKTSQFHGSHHKEFCMQYGFFNANAPDIAAVITGILRLEATSQI